jgi:hypothetical protein
MDPVYHSQLQWDCAIRSLPRGMRTRLHGLGLIRRRFPAAPFRPNAETL